MTKEDVTLEIKVVDDLSGIAKVTINDKEIELTEGKGTYTVTENGSYEVVVTDNVGNTSRETVVVDKIDKYTVVKEKEKNNNDEKTEESSVETSEEIVEEKGQKSDAISNEIVKRNTTEQIVQKAVVAAAGIGALSAGAYVFIISKKP